MSDTILGYNQAEREIAATELHGLLTILAIDSVSFGVDVALDRTLTGGGVRLAILDGIVTEEEGRTLLDEYQDDSAGLMGRLAQLADEHDSKE